MKLDKIIIALAIIIAGVIIGFFIYFSNNKQETVKNNDLTTTTSTVYEDSVQTTTKTMQGITPKAVNDLEEITNALAEKLGVPADSLIVSLNKKEGIYATGNVKEKTSEVGGGYFLAVKLVGVWQIAYDGQSTPSCSAVQPVDNSYYFPSSMVPECFSEGGDLIKR